jgi:hypothetical protein
MTGGKPVRMHAKPAVLTQRDAPPMIFVCGCGHSGTSLITAMLGVHKDIYAITEETALFTTGLANDDIREQFRQRYAPRVAEKGAHFLCEKTPNHIHHLARIRATFPGALIVVPVRDPRDVALSIKRRLGRLEAGYNRWRADNSVVQLEGSMRPEDVYIFRYEDLIDDVEGVLAKICRRLDLPYDPAMLEYYRDERVWFGAPRELPADPPSATEHEKFRNWQIKQPIMERRNQWRDHLSKEEIAEIEGVCGGLMDYFGYSRA